MSELLYGKYPLYKVRGKGLSWETARRDGFNYCVQINIDLPAENQPWFPVAGTQRGTLAGYPKGQIFAFAGSMGLASQQHPFDRRRTHRLNWQKQIASILGEKKVGWRVKNQGHTDKRTYIYTQDLEWLIEARLHGYNELLENIIKIEQYDPTLA